MRTANPPACLLDLPTDLLVRVASRCESPADIARVAAVSLLFHASLAEEGIRLWARERGFELPAQPESETCAVRWLCLAALLRESNPPARAAAGYSHSLFIDGEGRLSACGKATGRRGEEVTALLGHGEGVTRLNTPTRLPSLLGGERAKSVAAGATHSLALAGNGAVWSWGGGDSGRLGHGDEHDQWQPKKVEALAGQRVDAVSTAYDQSFAITAVGAVWSWGVGAGGQLGHGDEQRQSLPKQVEALAGQHVVAVTAGEHHGLALTADGAAWSWGYGHYGRLGHGDEQRQLLPKKIEAWSGRRVVAVSAGVDHSLAIAANGAVWSWGRGDNGQLGHGDEEDRLLPKKVEALAGQRVVAVSAGWLHSLVLTANGAVWSWGNGGWGQLGHGNYEDQLLPKKIEAFAGQRVVAVSAGSGQTFATTADGSFWSCGDGGFLKLGHGTSDDPLRRELVPKRIAVWT